MVGAGLVITGAGLVQWSAALVIPVFAAIGPPATSGWRFLSGAIVLLAFSRPRLRLWSREQWLGALILGVAMAFMNMCFYQAISRIPLGGAVAIEYLGPFLVAALGKRSWRHLVFVLMAGLGVVALARPGGTLNLLGIIFALGASAGWAVYAFASHRVGKLSTGFDGLAVSMSLAALVTLPFSVHTAPFLLSHPNTLLRIGLVGFMATALGYAAEMQALRILKPAIVSVLLAFDPAVAFFFGWLLLAQRMTFWDVVGLLCVVVAGVGVTLDNAEGERINSVG